jgi:hypothetical protein
LLLKSERMKRALGSDGTDGDENTIRSIAREFGIMYASLMRWAATTRGVSAQPVWKPVYVALSDLSDLPIRQVRQFVTDASLQLRDLVRAQRAGQPHGPLHLTLKFGLDDDALKRYDIALSRAKEFPSIEKPGRSHQIGISAG